jgi:hypothetical protein
MTPLNNIPATIIIDKVPHATITKETEFRYRSATCGGTTLGKIITTPGVRKSLITTGHGARGAGMYQRAHKEEKVRGVGIETAIRKTRCRSR